jgi:hypothetical protein
MIVSIVLFLSACATNISWCILLPVVSVLTLLASLREKKEIIKNPHGYQTAPFTRNRRMVAASATVDPATNNNHAKLVFDVTRPPHQLHSS